MLPPEAQSHYEEAREQQRLFAHFAGQLELARTQELLRRFLPAPPAVVLDIGGGPGAYALWLAGLGYQVHLIDAMPLHIEQAGQTAAANSAPAPESMAVGDARRLAFEDGCADAALLMGPLYHLIERSDRVLALREAYRCLRPGGLVFAVGISRFASALDGLAQGILWEPEFAGIVAQDLTDGQHRNPNDRPHWFTTTFFHHPDELRAEVAEAGFAVECLAGIEGPAWAISSLTEHWQDAGRREQILALARRLEAEPSLLGASAHIAALGRKTER
jgi:SAM-dependent methyltransferase